MKTLRKVLNMKALLLYSVSHSQEKMWSGTLLANSTQAAAVFHSQRQNNKNLLAMCHEVCEPVCSGASWIQIMPATNIPFISRPMTDTQGQK